MCFPVPLASTVLCEFTALLWRSEVTFSHSVEWFCKAMTKPGRVCLWHFSQLVDWGEIGKHFIHRQDLASYTRSVLCITLDTRRTSCLHGVSFLTLMYLEVFRYFEISLALSCLSDSHCLFPLYFTHIFTAIHMLTFIISMCVFLLLLLL